MIVTDSDVGGRQSAKADMQRIRAAGKQVNVPEGRLHVIGRSLPGGLNDESNEALLLHGTEPALV